MYGLNFNGGNEFYGGIMKSMEKSKPEIEITPVKITPKEEVPSNFYNDIQMRTNQNMEKTFIPNTIYLNFYHRDLNLIIDESLGYSQNINEGISYYSYKSDDSQIEIVFTNKWKLTITNEDEQFVFYCPPSNNNTYAGLIPGEWYSEQENIEAIVSFTALPHVIIDEEEYYNNEYNSNQRFNEENEFSNEIGEPGELNFIEEDPGVNSKILKICPEPRLKKYWFYYQYLERKLDVFRESKGISNGFTLRNSLNFSKDYLPEYLERMRVSIGRVEFMEEQGLDYGGIRPSFFKLVVQDIVNNFFETKEMIDLKQQKLDVKRKKNRFEENISKRRGSLSPIKSKLEQFKNNMRVDYDIYDLDNYELDEYCSLDDSSKKLYLRKFEHSPFNKEAFGYEFTYYYLGMAIASIMSCDSGENKIIHLGMNFSQYLIYIMSDNNYLGNWKQIIQCFQEDESLIYQNLEYMDIETVQDYLGDLELGYLPAELEEKHLLPAIFLMVLKNYESNIREIFNFMMGFKYYFNVPTKIFELKHIIEGSGIDKSTMIGILDKTEIIDYDRNNDMFMWMTQIIEEGDEESEEFNTFLKNLHIFWTGSEFEDFSKPYKLDITRTTDKENLPTSSTCFNNLHLIVYDSFDTFKEKLEIAARNANEGFGFA